MSLLQKKHLSFQASESRQARLLAVEEDASPLESSQSPAAVSQDERSWYIKLETSTSTLTSTVISTVVANGYQTLRFTSAAANPGCLPLAFLAANGVGAC